MKTKLHIYTPENTAVLLIDMQKNFLCYLDKNKLEKLITSQIDILKECKKKDIPLIAIRYKNSGRIDKRLYDLIKIVPRQEVLTKENDNGFEGTPLNEILSKFYTKNIFVMGVNATACVRDTVESAIKNNFKIISSKNVIGDIRDPDYHKWYKENGIYLENYRELPLFR